MFMVSCSSVFFTQDEMFDFIKPKLPQELHDKHKIVHFKVFNDEGGQQAVLMFAAYAENEQELEEYARESGTFDKYCLRDDCPYFDRENWKD